VRSPGRKAQLKQGDQGPPEAGEASACASRTRPFRWHAPWRPWRPAAARPRSRRHPASATQAACSDRARPSSWAGRRSGRGSSWSPGPLGHDPFRPSPAGADTPSPGGARAPVGHKPEQQQNRAIGSVERALVAGFMVASALTPGFRVTLFNGDRSERKLPRRLAACCRWRVRRDPARASSTGWRLAGGLPLCRRPWPPRHDRQDSQPAEQHHRSG